MSEKDLRKLLDEAIRLELHVSDLYVLFHTLFPDDAAFWWKLSLEEKNHAALLKSGREHFLPVGQFPVELIDVTLETLVARNQELRETCSGFAATPPSRADAFRFAFALETSAGELHFQHAMEELPRTQAMKIFQALNNEDRDHAERIRRYMEEHGIG